MKENLRRWESLLWFALKGALYLSILGIFVGFFALDSHSFRGLSRTLGITLSTFAVVGMLFLNVYGKFDIGRRKSKPIINSLVLATLLTDLVTYVQIMIMRTNTPDIYAFRFTSIPVLIGAYLAQVIVIIAFVYIGNHLFFQLHPPEKCCIITSSQESLDAIVKVVKKYQKQYHVEKVLDYRQKDLKQALKGFETVFLIDLPAADRSELVQYCYKTRKNIYFNPDIEDVVEMNAEYYVLEDMPLINNNVKALNMEQRITKRLMDLFLAVVLGVLSSPFWLVAALVIKLYDGGKVLFKQKRATINGKVFEVYKFRTMKENVENRSVTEGDSRITKPGQFLRKTRIDELPQLLNILKGDMTFVGPRPEMLENVEKYTEELPEFQYRLRVKAGLTGYAQISGKYNTTPKNKLLMDMMYIEQFSIWKDIQLLLQTAIVLLKKDSTEAFQRKKQTEYVFFSHEDDTK